MKKIKKAQKTTSVAPLLMLLKNKNSKILICAPSNAAIDEICARLATKGLYNSELKLIKSKFLRFGLYDRKDKEKKYLETYNGKILEKYSLEYISDQKYIISIKIMHFRPKMCNFSRNYIFPIGNM